MKGVTWILLLVNSCISLAANSQNKLDTVVMDYLRSIKHTPSPVLEVSKKRNKTIRNANFYVEKTNSFQHERILLNTFLFGSTTSHSRKYFILQIKSADNTIHQIIDDLTLEKAINNLFFYIQKYQLSESEKSLLVRELTYAYN